MPPELSGLAQVLAGLSQGAGVNDADLIPHADLPSGVKATLRGYQQQGYNWLSFMRRTGLRGGVGG